MRKIWPTRSSKTHLEEHEKVSSRSNKGFRGTHAHTAIFTERKPRAGYFKTKLKYEVCVLRIHTLFELYMQSWPKVLSLTGWLLLRLWRTCNCTARLSGKSRSKIFVWKMKWVMSSCYWQSFLKCQLQRPSSSSTFESSFDVRPLTRLILVWSPLSKKWLSTLRGSNLHDLGPTSKVFLQIKVSNLLSLKSLDKSLHVLHSLSRKYPLGGVTLGPPGATREIRNASRVSSKVLQL